MFSVFWCTIYVACCLKGDENTRECISFLFFLVCDDNYHIVDWTCVPCASLISVSGTAVLTDGSTETCIDTMAPEGAFAHFSLKTNYSCFHGNILGIEVTVASSTDCETVKHVTFARRYCNATLITCQLVTFKMLNEKNVCALRCVCDDSCMMRVFSGMISQNVQICEIQTV